MTIAEKLQLIAENEQKVFDAGKKSQYDEFWDNFQENGYKRNYTYGFANNGWTNELFKPKYDIVCGAWNSAQSMFFGCSRLSGNLDEILQECGVQFDLSKAHLLTYLFYNCAELTGIGEINTTSATNIGYAFQLCNKLKYIKKLILKNDGSQTIASAFDGCQELQDIVIEGVIGYNGISFKDCTKLSKASITNIVNALSNSTQGHTITFSNTAITNAFTNTAEWNALIATKSNWNITLI